MLFLRLDRNGTFYEGKFIKNYNVANVTCSRFLGVFLGASSPPNPDE